MNEDMIKTLVKAAYKEGGRDKTWMILESMNSLIDGASGDDKVCVIKVFRLLLQKITDSFPANDMTDQKFKDFLNEPHF